MIINSYRDIIFAKWSNPVMLKYDKVVKEFKKNIKYKKNFDNVLKEFKKLHWINVHSKKEYNTRINDIFDNTNNFIHKKINKYKSELLGLEKQIEINNRNREKVLQKTNQQRCPICYKNKVKSYAITRCGHYYCLKCIQKSINTKFKCPICRSILFFEDIRFFSDNEHKHLIKKKNIKNTYPIDYTMSRNSDIVYLPPFSNMMIRNPKDKSLLINMTNITCNTDQYNFENFLDYNKFNNLISRIEDNIKESYDKRLARIVNIFMYLVKSGRGGRNNNINEIVNPNTMDE